jgi:pSer/pThr/pTyr-binding forkhead associated (FHA) protein
MIICRYCKAKNAANTVFCEECGNDLLQYQSGSMTPPHADGQEETASDHLPRIIRVIILKSGRAIDIPYGHDILIGRGDAAQGIAPDIDLSNEGGFEAGISRRHAQICYQGEQVLIQDLASTNGVLLNQKPLTPYLAQPLQQGDEIKLGTLVLRIEFR